MALGYLAYWYGPVGVLWLFEELWENWLWMSEQAKGYRKTTVPQDLTTMASPVTVQVTDASFDGKTYTVTIEAKWRGVPLTPWGPYVEPPQGLKGYEPVTRFKCVRVRVTLSWEGGGTTVTLDVPKYGSASTTVKLEKPYGRASVAVAYVYEADEDELKKFEEQTRREGTLLLTTLIATALAPYAAKVGSLPYLSELASKVAEYLLKAQLITPETMTYWIARDRLIDIISKMIKAGAIAGGLAAAASAIIQAAKGDVEATAKTETATAVAAEKQKAEAEAKAPTAAAPGGSPRPQEKFAMM